MGPLDFEKQMPRGPREQLAGLYFMARTVDKLRAEQPGGKLGPYLNRADGVIDFTGSAVRVVTTKRVFGPWSSASAL